MLLNMASTVVTTNPNPRVIPASSPPDPEVSGVPDQISPRNTEDPSNSQYTEANDAQNGEIHGDQHRPNLDSVSPQDLLPVDGDEEEKLESLTDLQFKKKDFKKSRAQLFQLVLLTASLKSLKQQYTQGNPPQPLLRNHSTVSNFGTTNSKNFQLFIQAPVLLSVTNLRQSDEVKIGQQLPFEDRNDLIVEFASSARPDSQVVPTTEIQQQQEPLEEEDDDDDDIYREETTLQQQRLTINALKKLSLLLAPIIRSEEEEIDIQPRQLTTKLLNGSVVPDLKMKTRPYQPAQVDLLSFSSLTRQLKHMTLPETKTEAKGEARAEARADRQQHSQNQSQAHSQSQVQNQSQQSQSQQSQFQGLPPSQAPQQIPQQIPQSQQHSQESHVPVGLYSERGRQSQGGPRERGREKERPSQLPIQSGPSTGPNQTSSGPKSAAIPVNGFKPTFGNIEHTIGGRNTPAYPVVPPHDMNIRNRKVSLQHEPQPPPKHLPDKKLQQIKGLRSPMYVPAVLRRNHEDEVGPVSSNGLDPDSAEPAILAVALPAKDTGLSATSVRLFDLAYSSELMTLPALHLKTGPFTLSKRQYEYILRAAPTRKHWLKDESVVQCGISSCRKNFNFFERRHHCRKCGGIFCKEHTSHFLYINHLAQFTTGGRGTLSRVCDNCIEDYNEFIKNEFGVSSQAPRRELPPQALPVQSMPPTDFRREMFKAKEPLLLPISPVTKGDMNEQLVGSVPANWSWLSF